MNASRKNIVAETYTGIYEGVLCDGVISYKGIPYAKPPVGELRWRAPQELETSAEYQLCDRFGKSGIQSHDELEPACFNEQGEDCLTLNIWTAGSEKGMKKPVMVWFHGGVYGWGGTADPVCDGHNFVQAHNDVIYVSVNSRLGFLGYIDLSCVPGGESYKDINLGLMDQAMAVKWIYKNISAFGGDSENITLFGSSSGAVNIGILMNMPCVNKFFNRAIIQGGPFLRGLSGNVEEARHVAERLLESTGTRNMAELLALSEEELAEANSREEFSVYCPGPVNDGRLYGSLWDEIKKGTSKHIDLLIGCNHDEFYYTSFIEGSLDKANDFYARKLEKEKEHMADNVLEKLGDFFALYDSECYESDDSRKTTQCIRYQCESKMRIPTIQQGLEHKKAGGNTYMYLWKYPSSLPDVGACMGVDVSYVLNNLHVTTYTGDRINKGLAADVQNMWVNFAKTGVPEMGGVSWPQYDEENRYTMIIDENAEWHVESDPMSESRKLIEEIQGYE